jgi:hypothetical protein
MSVIDLNKKRRRAPRDLVAIDKTSGPARYYDKMMRDIENDLGGRRNLSRIETEWIKGFCGCATRLEYLNFQIMLGEASDRDVSSYAQLASTMLRIGSKLGLSPRHNKADAGPAPGSLGAVLLADIERQHREDNERNRQKQEAFEGKQRASASASADVSNDGNAA